MLVDIISSKHLLTTDEIPSASGIEFYNEHFYVVGDNSPYLFVLSNNLEIIERIKIFPSEELKAIPKLKKPDFEATAILNDNDVDKLLIFGSGSYEEIRNKLVVFDLNSRQIVNEYNLSAFYNWLCKHGQSDINIEGAFCFHQQVILFNRATNFALVIDWEKLIENKFEETKLCEIRIPNVENNYVGISGACLIDDTVILTGSIEKTEDWVNDGEILGSYLMKIPINQILEKDMIHIAQISKISNQKKIESICIMNTTKTDITAMLVVDQDNATSEFIEVIFK